MEPDNEAPPLSFDPSQPSEARVYNELLDGKDNFEVDRSAVRLIEETTGQARIAARQNRAFMRRASRWLASAAGIGQYLDIGCGLPSEPNVHQVVQEIIPDARVVYVDNDVHVGSHAKAILTASPPGECSYVHSDIRDPEKILREATATLDLRQPVAVLLFAVLHFLEDDRDAPAGIVRQLMDSMPPGSHLALSHVVMPETIGPEVQAVQDVYADMPSKGVYPRTVPDIARFFAGLEVAEPGLVQVTRWRPDPPDEDPPESVIYGGVARKAA